jgi:hypothetical protein
MGTRWLKELVQRLATETRLEHDPLGSVDWGALERNPTPGYEMVYAMGANQEFAKRVEDSARFHQWLEDGKRVGHAPKLSPYFRDMSIEEWRELTRDTLIHMPGPEHEVQDSGNFLGPSRPSTPHFSYTNPDPTPEWNEFDPRISYYCRVNEPPVRDEHGHLRWFEDIYGHYADVHEVSDVDLGEEERYEDDPEPEPSSENSGSEQPDDIDSQVPKHWHRHVVEESDEDSEEESDSDVVEVSGPSDESDSDVVEISKPQPPPQNVVDKDDEDDVIPSVKEVASQHSRHSHESRPEAPRGEAPNPPKSTTHTYQDFNDTKKEWKRKKLFWDDKWNVAKRRVKGEGLHEDARGRRMVWWMQHLMKTFKPTGGPKAERHYFKRFLPDKYRKYWTAPE